jgi:hypothetical protein
MINKSTEDETVGDSLKFLRIFSFYLFKCPRIRMQAAADPKHSKILPDPPTLPKFKGTNKMKGRAAACDFQRKCFKTH